MTSSQVNALIASAYNLHIQAGEPMTPANAARLSRRDRAALCRVLEAKGGSDLYSREQAHEAFVVVVAS